MPRLVPDAATEVPAGQKLPAVHATLVPTIVMPVVAHTYPAVHVVGCCTLVAPVQNGPALQNRAHEVAGAGQALPAAVLC